MSNVENLIIQNDLVFLKLFGRPENKNITKGFLEKVLGIKIKDLVFSSDTRVEGEELDDKSGRIDISATLDDGTKVFIEMQYQSYDAMTSRFLLYWARKYAEGLKRGGHYNELHKTIGILITGYNLSNTKDIKDYHNVWQILARDQNGKEIVFNDDLEIHTIELTKYDENAIQHPDSSWIKFLRGNEIMVKEFDGDKALKEAKEELDRLYASPEDTAEYRVREKRLEDHYAMLMSMRREGREEGLKEGHENGVKEGEQRGRDEERKQVVLNLNKQGISIDIICKATKLSKEEVEKIISENIN